MRFFSFLAATLAVTVNAGSFGRRNNAAFAAIKTGDKLPYVDMLWGFPDPHVVNLPEYCGGRNVIIVGMPGAFTPTSSLTQVPSYVENQDALKEAGVEEVIFYCVNDSAVMGIWMSKLDLGGTMTQMFGDPTGEFTKACGMEMTHPGPVELGLIGRSKRFAMHVVNNMVEYVAVSESEDDPTGDANPDATCAPAIIEAIKARKLIDA
jgi:peroxiredoxin